MSASVTRIYPERVADAGPMAKPSELKKPNRPISQEAFEAVQRNIRQNAKDAADIRACKMAAKRIDGELAELILLDVSPLMIRNMMAGKMTQLIEDEDYYLQNMMDFNDGGPS